jgi:hypothetical protein
MDLSGVANDYDITEAKKLLIMELTEALANDLPRDLRNDLYKDSLANPVTFVITHEDIDGELVKNPYQFVKAAKLYSEIMSGGRPYIGIAFGLDAKCSGAQLGALVVNDETIAAACGFSEKDLKDAYERAAGILTKRDIGTTSNPLTRSDIKTNFMSVFYGQGPNAFMDKRNLTPHAWELVHGNEEPTLARAKTYHSGIAASFGKGLGDLRTKLKAYRNKLEGNVSFSMPDGFPVTMGYRHSVDILGCVTGYSYPPNALVHSKRTGNYVNLKCPTFQLAAYNTEDFVRTSFVNFIHSVDALLSRLICANLSRLGSRHIVNIHDCQRVNIHDIDLLEKAIKLAYLEMFGSKTLEDSYTPDLVLGGDMLDLLFSGINRYLVVEGTGPDKPSQFTEGNRDMVRIKNVKFTSLVDCLGDEDTLVGYYG